MYDIGTRSKYLSSFYPVFSHTKKATSILILTPSTQIENEYIGVPGVKVVGVGNAKVCNYSFFMRGLRV